MNGQPKQVYAFGPFRFDPEEHLLVRDGKAIPLAPKVVETLLLFVQNAGRLIEKDDLMRRVWPSTFVEEGNLNKNIFTLRKTLGQWDGGLEYIETVPKRGYRFVAPVKLERETDAKPQLAAEMVSNFQDTTARASLNATRVTAILVAAGAIGLYLFWFVRRQQPAPEPKVSQLTANSSDNPVTSSSISPDGKYLAFTDKTERMRVKLIGTDETEAISEPESLKGIPVAWEIVGWFPDGTRFLANLHSPQSYPWTEYVPANVEDTSIWIVSLLGGVPRKLRDSARAFSVSPDGSLLAFGTGTSELGNREIWLMDPGGQQARKLYDTDGDTAISNLQWSRDGQRTIYLKRGRSHSALISRDLNGGPPTTVLSISNPDELKDFIWLRDGRLIYAISEDQEINSCNYWQFKIDTGTGEPIGRPRRVTNWSGFCLYRASATADGKRLVFHKWARRTTVYVADTEVDHAWATSTKHLTLNEYVNAAETWTPDSKALIFRSWRNGHLRLFKQAVDSDTEEPVLIGAANVGGTSISPDGSWLFYLDCGKGGDCDLPTTSLMRIPIQGGTPQQVLTSDTYGRPRCAVSPSLLCVIAEQSEDGKPLIFTAFDALMGRGHELTRFETEPGASYTWGLAPDGSHVAVLKNGDARIHVLSLNGQASREIAVKRWNHLAGVYWAADGKSWFVCGLTQSGSVLLHVDLQGRPAPVWKEKGMTIAYGLPSPDGRRLAIVGTTITSNVWIMEIFQI